MDRYAVIGHPIAHSKSPRIHGLFAAQTGQAMTYAAMLAPLDGFAATAQSFFASGGKGLNVTVPFKEQAAALVTMRDPVAEHAGAVNTIAVGADGQLQGYNTDGVGLVRDLANNLAVVLSGSRVLILGAGGAVRGIVAPLLAAGAGSIHILNRTAAKAAAIATSYGDNVVRLYTTDDGQAFDLIINGTSTGLLGVDLLGGEFSMPDQIVGTNTVCYDMTYGAGAAVFCRWATQHHAARVSDGLGMLVEQAAEAFFIWRGVRPQTHSVIDTLRSEVRP